MNERRAAARLRRRIAFLIAMTGLSLELSASHARGDSFRFGKAEGFVTGSGLVLGVLDDRIFEQGPCRWCESNRLDDWFLANDHTLHRRASVASDAGLAVALTTSLGASGALDRKGGDELGAWATSVGATMIAVQVTKNLVRRRRPFAGENPSGNTDDNKSFFSAHTAFSVAGAVAAHRIRGLTGRKAGQMYARAALLSSAVTGVLRIAARKHYFTDVVVGAAVGWGAGYVVPKAMWRGSTEEPVAVQRAAVTIPMACLVHERASVSLAIVGSGSGSTGFGISVLWR